MTATNRAELLTLSAGKATPPYPGRNLGSRIQDSSNSADISSRSIRAQGPAIHAGLSRGGLREPESQAVRLPGGQGPGRRPYGRHLRAGVWGCVPPAAPATATLSPGTSPSPRTRPVASWVSPATQTVAATAVSPGPPRSSGPSCATSTPWRACSRPRSRSPAEQARPAPRSHARGGTLRGTTACPTAGDDMRPGAVLLQDCPGRTCVMTPGPPWHTRGANGRREARVTGGVEPLLVTSAPPTTYRQRIPTVRF